MIKVVRSKPECSVSGALGLVFRMSQLVGVGPLTFKKRGRSWTIGLSPTLCSASFIAATAMNIAALTGLLLDLQAVPSQSARVRSPTRRFVWISDYIVVLLTASIAAYGAPMRCKETIACLSRLEKMNVAAYSNATNEWKTSVGVVIYLVFAISLLATDYSIFIKDVLLNKREFRAACLYSSYYYAYLLLFLLELQFVFTALEFSKALGVICNSIIEVTQFLNTTHAPYDKMMTKRTPKQSLNLVIDLMTTTNFGTGYVGGLPSKSISETIRRLASTYTQACQVVRQIDSCHGHGVLLLLLSFLLHLVITPYNFILHITTSGKGMDFAASLQLLWCALHFACTVMVAEPSYRTQLEVQRTNVVISSMLMKTTDRTVCKELEKFSTYLTLSNVSYNPLGVFTLSRSLVASLIGSVATYLVIIIQFQMSEH